MSESDFRRLRPLASLFRETHNGTPRPDLQPRDQIRSAFCEVWPRLRAMLRESTTQYAVAAIFPDGEEISSLALSFDEDPFVGDSSVHDTIVGRHPQCDLHLNEDETLSLRHLLLRIFRGQDGQVGLRCLDLHTDSGLEDATGSPFRSAMTRGHLFFRAAGYLFYAVRRGAELFPEDPLGAWAAIEGQSDPISTSEGIVEPPVLRPRPRLQLVSEFGHFPQFTQVDGVLNLGAVDLGSDKAVGALSLRGWEVDISVRVPASVLARGILIGRYARCQLRTEIEECLSEFSRVHLLLLLDESGLWAIDTASSNGSAMNGRYFRTAKLERDSLIELPGDMNLRWQAI